MKFIILILAVFFLVGCDLEPEYDTFDSVPVDTVPVDYLTYSEYATLLDTLQSKLDITKSTIDLELDILAPGSSYVYSYYESGSYSCYNFNWSSYNSNTYSWNYYINVDIWVVSGSLNRDMCSYYDG